MHVDLILVSSNPNLAAPNY